MNPACPACGSSDTIRVGGAEYQCPRWRHEPCYTAANSHTIPARERCTVFVPTVPAP
jgi:hypothetical protein